MNNMTEFISFLADIGCRFEENAILAKYLTFRVGGPCRVMVFPDSADKLLKIVDYINKNGIKHYVIGNGSNLIAPDDGFDGVIINTSALDFIELIDSTVIRVGAGTPLIKVCRYALENSLTGLEFAYGIPGSAGGAVYMNAGAYGGEIKDVFLMSEHIDSNCSSASFDSEGAGLSYRKSNYSGTDLIITAVTLKLSPGNSEEIKAKMNDLMSRRKDKQPLDFPSAGSTFKRPQGYFAGALIEQAGLKGYSVGGAQVSEKHAGFVINKGNATCDDILKLIKHCQNAVCENSGVELETEVKIIC